MCLPAGGFPVYIPTTAFATAVQDNIASSCPGVSSEAALYQKMFALYAGAPGASRATTYL